MQLTHDTMRTAIDPLGKCVVIVILILVAGMVSPICAAAIALLFVLTCQHLDYLDERAANIAEFARKELIDIASLLVASTTPVFSRESVFRYDIATVPEQDYGYVDILSIGAQLASASFSP